MSAIYNLYKRYGQFSGFEDLIFDLKMVRFSESLMLLGKRSHFFGLERILFLGHNKQTLYFLFEMLIFF